jgi:antirestriction protein ArdC
MSVYDYVNERLLKAIERGIIPWERPWRCEGFGNPVTGGVYHGSNIMMAGIHNAINGFKSPHFVTMNQVNKLGAQVIKGEGKNYCMITKFDFIPDKKDPTKVIPMLRYYRLYNKEQTTLPRSLFAEPDVHININPFEYQYGYEGGPKVAYDQANRAFYNVEKDEVHLPAENEFKSESFLRQTLYHELAHSTRHPSRLDRKKKSYAKEELVAEIAAAFMMHEAGLEPMYENSGTYLAGWMSALEDDKTLFVSAAAKAEKAVKYILEHPMDAKIAV